MRLSSMVILVIVAVTMPAASFGADCADVDNSGATNILDITYLIDFLYMGGPDPACDLSLPGDCGDVNSSESVNILDITYLIDYLYQDGPAPQCASISVPATTTIIPPESTDVILRYDTSGTIVLDSSSAYAQGLSVGDVVTGQDDETAPDGLLRKITSITPVGDSIVLETVQATLMESFEMVAISETHQLRPSDVVSVKLRDGVEFNPGKDDETFNVPLTCVLYDFDGDENGTTNDQIRISGQYSFTAQVFAEIETDWLILEKFEAGIQTNDEVSLELTAAIEYEFGTEEGIDLATFHFAPIPLGGAVWLVPTVVVTAHINGSLTLTFETGIAYTQQLKYGFGYFDGEFYNINESTKEFTYTPPHFTAEFDFEPALSLNTACLLYGLAGPYMSGKGGIHFNATLNADPEVQELILTLEAILYATVGIQCDILDLNYNKEYQLYVYPIGQWTFSLDSSCAFTITDIDGNEYCIIQIGEQWWMAENLKVTHFRNGDPIPHILDSVQWDNLGYNDPAYCQYDNDPVNVDTYGLLYSFGAVNDSRGLAPEGWHVATDADWLELEEYLGMSTYDLYLLGWRGTDEGGKLKETGIAHWLSPNTGATNETGFSARPDGGRIYDGSFWGLTGSAAYWTATAPNSTQAYFRSLYYDYSTIYCELWPRYFGLSVRCVMD